MNLTQVFEFLRRIAFIGPRKEGALLYGCCGWILLGVEVLNQNRSTKIKTNKLLKPL